MISAVYDKEGDVLYVKYAGTQTWFGKEIVPNVVLRMSADQQVVGVTIINFLAEFVPQNNVAKINDPRIPQALLNFLQQTILDPDKVYEWKLHEEY